MKSFFMHTTKTDQTERMRRLILVFVGPTCQQVRFLSLRFIYLSPKHVETKVNLSLAPNKVLFQPKIVDSFLISARNMC